MRPLPFISKSYGWILIVFLGATAGLGVGLGLTFIRAHGDEPLRATASECAGFGSASFSEAESLDHLLRRADVVIKGKIANRSNDSDEYARGLAYPSLRYIIYTVEVSDVVVGEMDEQTITLGLPFAEVCLDPGDTEYYLFMGRTHEPGEALKDDPYSVQNPADYELRSFGPNNVFTVKSGLVEPLKEITSPVMEEYRGVTEESFRNSVLESAARVK